MARSSSHLEKTLRGLIASALLLTAPLSAQAQDISSGLIGHWRMDESSGDLTDSSANTNTGIANGPLTYLTSSGKIGGALQWDGGTSTYIDVGNPTAFDLANGTISLWFYTTNEDYGYNRALVAKNASGNNDGDLLLWYRNTIPDTLSLRITDGGLDTQISADSAGITENSWNHIAATFGSSGMKLYLNGVQQTETNALTQGMMNASATLYFGNNGPAESLALANNDRLDDIRIYNRVLSDSDIAVLASGTIPSSIRYNDTSEAIEYHDGTDWVHAGLGSYSPNAVDFNSSTYFLSGTTLNVQDSKKVTGSVWYKADTDGAYEHIIFGRSPGCSGNCFRILKNNNDSFRINGVNMNMRSSISSVTAASGWNHLLFSFDLGDTSKRHLYVNGVSDLDSVGSYTDAEVPYSELFYGINTLVDTSGASTSVNDIGEVADLWIDFGTYIDFSVAANREMFISANGMPMYQGTDGSLQTGFQPDIFLSGDTADWHINKGTGGGFTENGTLTDATTQPGGTSSEMTWSQVGSSLNSSLGGPAITKLNGNTIAFLDGINDELTTLEFDGSNWAIVGTGLGIAGVNYPTMTTIAPNTVAMVDEGNDELRTYTWDGSNWTQTGNGLALASIGGDLSITTLDTNTVVFLGRSLDELTTFEWDGTDWSQVGNELPITNAFNPSITKIDDNTIALYATSSVSALRTYEWDGSDWSQIGNELSGTMDKADITTLETNKIALWGETHEELRVYEWDGSDWSQIGNGTSETIPFSGYIRLAALDRKTVALVHDPDNDLKTFTLSDPTPCSSPTAQPGSIIYNTDDVVMQYCNGTDWVAMGPVGGTGGGGCVSPAGSVGDIIFNSAYSSLQYCNSEDWVAIGRGDPLTIGLVGHWKLDDGTGSSVASDSSGKGNHGTLTSMDSATDWVLGPLNGGLDFDGSNDRVVVSDSASLSHTGELSIAFWVYNHSLPTNKEFIGKVNAGSTLWEYSIQTDNDEISLFYCIGANALCDFSPGNFHVTTTTDANMVVDTWYHVVMTYNDAADSLLFYVDGVLKSTTNAAGNGAANSIVNASNDLYIGWSQYPGSQTDSVLDDVRIYNRAITAAEVSALYDLGTPPIDIVSGLIHHWELDETSGSTITDSAGSLNGTWDDSGNNDVAEETVAGVIGTALSFDGSTEILTGASFNVPQIATISMWAKFDSLGSDLRFFGSDNDFEIVKNGSDLIDADILEGVNNAVSSTVVGTGTWYHIVVAYDGTADTSNLYINGVLEDTGEATGTPPTPDTLGIGARDGTGSEHEGTLDDVRIYNRVLTAQQVGALYALGTNDVTSGLVGYWELNETSGSSIADSAGANTGTWADPSNDDVTEETAAGKVGTALTFSDSNGEQVLVASDPSLEGFSEFTLSAWIYPTQDGAGCASRVISKPNATTGDDYMIGLVANNFDPMMRVSTNSGGQTTYIATGTVTQNAWNHIVGTWDGSEINFYIDGVLDAASPVAKGGTLDDNNGGLSLGTHTNDVAGCRGFSGLIDEARIYNRALSASEVLNVYNATK